MKRPPSKKDVNHASPVLAIVAITLASLLALIEAERSWIGYVAPADVLLSDLP